MPSVDITAVVNAHREGLIIHSSLMSVSRAKAHAEKSGFKVEIIVVLDRADALTTRMVENWREKSVQIIRVDNGDLGKSRNDAIDKASGDWIAFLDADDLWCTTWLGRALAAATYDQRNIVWHPEVNIIFGSHPNIFRHIDMESDEFDPLSLCASNLWTALCMARRSLFAAVPYPWTNLENKIGYEDWGWNMAAIGQGAIHKIVQGTGHAIRAKPGSLVKKTSLAGAIPKPDKLFRNYLFEYQSRPRKREPGWLEPRNALAPGRLQALE
jgi:glycosyltransferase involved in cell wall biosynthesis